MNKRQRSQFNMLETVAKHFEIYRTIWSPNVLISQTYATLTAKIDGITEAARLQTHTSAGATSDKATLRKDLEAKALFLSEAICAYTSLNPGQGQLYQTVYITQSKLAKMRESDLLYYVDCLHDAALEVIENLWPYGVSEATITDLMVAKTDFYEMTKTSKEVVANRKEATADVSVLLQQAIALLDDTMDKIIKVLRPANPEFVTVYFNERKIGKVGSRTMSLEILTLNAAEKTPLAQAKIEVVDTKIKRISTQKGQNRVQNLKEGNYMLSVTHPDFVSQMVPFTVRSGQTTELVVEMEEEVAKTQSFKGAKVLRNFDASDPGN